MTDTDNQSPDDDAITVHLNLCDTFDEANTKTLLSKT